PARTINRPITTRRLKNPPLPRLRQRSCEVDFFFMGSYGGSGLNLDRSFCFLAVLVFQLRVRKRRRTWRGIKPAPDSDPFSDAESGENLACLSREFAPGANR